jgi:hypothetical protein
VRIEPAPAEVIDEPVAAVTPIVDAPPRNPVVTPPLDVDAGLPPPPQVEILVNVTVASGSQWRLPGGAWQPVDGRAFKVVIDQPTTVEVKNDCCQTVPVALDPATTQATASLQFKPGEIKLTCDIADRDEVSVSVEYTSKGKQESRTPKLGSTVYIPFELNATSSQKPVTVSFTNGVTTDTQQVTVSAGRITEVKCGL